MYEYRWERRRIAERPTEVNNSLDVWLATSDVFQYAEREKMVVLALDQMNHLMGREVLWTGTAHDMPARVGEVFTFPLRLNATRIILAHNHPSGGTAPSASDIVFTQEAVKAGDLLGVSVLDHVVVADGGRSTSMRDDRIVDFRRAP